MSQVAHETLDTALREIDSLRRNLKRSSASQVKAIDEREIARATALAWFNNHFHRLHQEIEADELSQRSESYARLMEYSDKATSRTKYEKLLKPLVKDLKNLRRHILDNTSSSVGDSTDAVPDFSSLIGDTKMQGILADRWKECATCISAGAPLAALVMMGGFLETLLLARFNREVNKDHIFRSPVAPKDRKTKKPLPIKEWTLRNYLDVGHDLGWITRSTKDVGEVVRDYRNYVHPYKQASHGIVLETNDARLFWEISKEMARQLLSGNR